MRFGKKIVSAVCAFLWAANASSAYADEAGASRCVDVARSHVSFSVTHLFVSHVSGSVPVLSACIVLPKDSALPSSVSATLDPTRVDTRDPDRNDSLQGPDWFDTKRFPTWSFASTSIVPNTGGAFTANGMLTVHGVAAPVTLDVKTMRGLPNPAYHAVGHVDRHVFGMKTTPIDGTIGSDVQLSLDLEFPHIASPKKK